MVGTLHEDICAFMDTLVSSVTQLTCMLNDAHQQYMKYRWKDIDGGFFFFNLIFVVPSIMLYSSEISPARCNNCVFILRNGFILHVWGDNLTHHQEYICCIWAQVSRLTYVVSFCQMCQ